VTHDHWNAVFSLLEENLSTNFSIAELAATAGVSTSCFARSFKQLTGRTPCNYVIHQRIEKAKQLLQERKLDLVKIAAEVGFADQAHLTRYFKRLTGMTPAQFCKQSRTQQRFPTMILSELYKGSTPRSTAELFKTGIRFTAILCTY
jgi:AraC-like DNA-binding protein